MVVGAGGIGSAVLMYIAGFGVGQITIIDDDTVSPSNLHRQTIHSTTYTNKLKSLSAKNFIQNLNPHIKIITHQSRLNQKNIEELMGKCDYVLDGCDNPETRYLVNDYCVANGIVLITGGAI